MNDRGRSIIVTVGVLVACLTLGTSGVCGGPKPVRHCITPTNVDLNVRYGISDAIVAPFCTEVTSGRRWVVSNGWFMNTFFEFVPVGFVPAGATPLEDFKAKFIGVKYVVDAGTPQEKTYQFPNDESLGIVLDASRRCGSVRS